jgi:hypothetical protein
VTDETARRPIWHWPCLVALAAWVGLVAWSLVQVVPAYSDASAAASSKSAKRALDGSFDTPLVVILLALLLAVPAGILLWRRYRGRWWAAGLPLSLVVLFIWWFVRDGVTSTYVGQWCDPHAVTLPLQLAGGVAGLVLALSAIGLRGLSEPNIGRSSSAWVVRDELKGMEEAAHGYPDYRPGG